MGSVFVAKERQRDSVELDNQEPQARIAFGGVYFFLYPLFLRLRDTTGELIDPQTDAFFHGSSLDELQRCLNQSRQRLLATPNEWEQHVGTYSTGEPCQERTSKAAVLDLLDRLDRAVVHAREEGLGVFFLGE